MAAFTPPASLIHRAAMHRVLGDPLRLAIVDALALSDRSPSELEAMLGASSNLLAHHLNALEGAGIVERVRSHGDARRRYVRLSAPEPGEAVPDTARLHPSRVLFVCTGNSARSPIASAVWAATVPGVPSTSAGTRPASEVHPLAMRAAQRAGYLVEHTPVEVSAVLRPEDLVVTVCDEAHESLGGRPSTRALHWSLPDPVRSGRAAAFDRTVEEIRHRVQRLARCMASQGHVSTGQGVRDV